MKMRYGTVAAVLDSVREIGRITAAVLHAIQRAIAEQTVEMLRIVRFVAREVFAGAVLHKAAEAAFFQTRFPFLSRDRIGTPIDHRAVSRFG